MLKFSPTYRKVFNIHSIFFRQQFFINIFFTNITTASFISCRQLQLCWKFYESNSLKILVAKSSWFWHFTSCWVRHFTSYSSVTSLWPRGIYQQQNLFFRESVFSIWDDGFDYYGVYYDDLVNVWTKHHDHGFEERLLELWIITMIYRLWEIKKTVRKKDFLYFFIFFGIFVD